MGAVLATMLATGCTKEDRPAPTPAGAAEATTSFQFRVNGRQYETLGGFAIDPDKGAKIVRSADGRSYNLYAWVEAPFRFFVMIPMPAPLTVGTYQFSESTGASAGEVRLADLLNASYALGSEDIYSVRITRVGNGTVDGTFSAQRLTRVSGDSRAPQTIQVTQGAFEGVRVF